MELEMPLTPTLSPRPAGKSTPNFVLAGLVPAIHALGAVEGKTWMRGSSPRKTTQNRFLWVQHKLSLGKFSPYSSAPSRE